MENCPKKKKGICSSKDSVKNRKDNTYNEKNVANHVSSRSLVS